MVSAGLVPIDAGRGPHRRVLATGLSQPRAQSRGGRPHRRPDRHDGAQGEPAAARRAERAPRPLSRGIAHAKRPAAEVPEERQVREVRDRGRGHEALPRRGRPAAQVRRPVRPRLPADGRAGLPGERARPRPAQPCRRDRRHAGDAEDRRGTEGRRHPPARAEHPRRRQVHALHDGPLLQGRADGRAQQGPVRLRLVQRGARAHPASCARRRRPAASTRTSGSTTWRSSRPRASGAKRSSTFPTSTSTTSPTRWPSSR